MQSHRAKGANKATLVPARGADEDHISHSSAGQVATSSASTAATSLQLLSLSVKDKRLQSVVTALRGLLQALNEREQVASDEEINAILEAWQLASEVKASEDAARINGAGAAGGDGDSEAGGRGGRGEGTSKLQQIVEVITAKTEAIRKQQQQQRLKQQGREKGAAIGMAEGRNQSDLFSTAAAVLRGRQEVAAAKFRAQQAADALFRAQEEAMMAEDAEEQEEEEQYMRLKRRGHEKTAFRRGLYNQDASSTGHKDDKAGDSSLGTLSAASRQLQPFPSLPYQQHHHHSGSSHLLSFQQYQQQQQQQQQIIAAAISAATSAAAINRNGGSDGMTFSGGEEESSSSSSSSSSSIQAVVVAAATAAAAAAFQQQQQTVPFGLLGSSGPAPPFYPLSASSAMLAPFSSAMMPRGALSTVPSCSASSSSSSLGVSVPAPAIATSSASAGSASSAASVDASFKEVTLMMQEMRNFFNRQKELIKANATATAAAKIAGATETAAVTAHEEEKGEKQQRRRSTEQNGDGTETDTKECTRAIDRSRLQLVAMLKPKQKGSLPSSSSASSSSSSSSSSVQFVPCLETFKALSISNPYVLELPPPPSPPGTAEEAEGTTIHTLKLLLVPPLAAKNGEDAQATGKASAKAGSRKDAAVPEPVLAALLQHSPPDLLGLIKAIRAESGGSSKEAKRIIRALIAGHGLKLQAGGIVDASTGANVSIVGAAPDAEADAGVVANQEEGKEKGDDSQEEEKAKATSMLAMAESADKEKAKKEDKGKEQATSSSSFPSSSHADAELQQQGESRSIKPILKKPSDASFSSSAAPVVAFAPRPAVRPQRTDDVTDADGRFDVLRETSSGQRTKNKKNKEENAFPPVPAPKPQRPPTAPTVALPASSASSFTFREEEEPAQPPKGKAKGGTTAIGGACVKGEGEEQQKDDREEEEQGQEVEEPKAKRPKKDAISATATKPPAAAPSLADIGSAALLSRLAPPPPPRAQVVGAAESAVPRQHLRGSTKNNIGNSNNSSTALLAPAGLKPSFARAGVDATGGGGGGLPLDVGQLSASNVLERRRGASTTGVIVKPAPQLQPSSKLSSLFDPSLDDQGVSISMPAALQPKSAVAPAVKAGVTGKKKAVKPIAAVSSMDVDGNDYQGPAAAAQALNPEEGEEAGNDDDEDEDDDAALALSSALDALSGSQSKPKPKPSNRLVATAAATGLSHAASSLLFSQSQSQDDDDNDNNGSSKSDRNGKGNGKKKHSKLLLSPEEEPVVSTLEEAEEDGEADGADSAVAVKGKGKGKGKPKQTAAKGKGKEKAGLAAAARMAMALDGTDDEEEDRPSSIEDSSQEKSKKKGSSPPFPPGPLPPPPQQSRIVHRYGSKGISGTRLSIWMVKSPTPSNSSADEAEAEDAFGEVAEKEGKNNKLGAGGKKAGAEPANKKR